MFKFWNIFVYMGSRLVDSMEMYWFGTDTVASGTSLCNTCTYI